MTVRQEAPTAVVTFGDLVSATYIQLAMLPTNATGLSIRIHKVRVWGALPVLSTSKSEPVIVQVMDWINPNLTFPTILEEFTRFPDVVNRACIAYRYPLAHRNITIPSGPTGSSTVLLRTRGLGPSAVIYWDVQWRSPANILP